MFLSLLLQIIYDIVYWPQVACQSRDDCWNSAKSSRMDWQVTQLSQRNRAAGCGLEAT